VLEAEVGAKGTVKISRRSPVGKRLLDGSKQGLTLGVRRI